MATQVLAADVEEHLPPVTPEESQLAKQAMAVNRSHYICISTHKKNISCILGDVDILLFKLDNLSP